MITIECNYSKKLGLPQYSSHQFGITLRAELTNLDEVQAQSARLYLLLQQSVDASLQQPGLVPAVDGLPSRSAAHDGRNHSADPDAWACSPKQRSLILRVAKEKGLPETQLEALAQSQFGKPPCKLTKPEASGLISKLLAERPGPANANGG
ncbi:MAG TPA: hypothetical protein VKY92_10775 [Verrucomicrobiae bacterium]|nr:hypothetical protein [Verrucomicrobiae bacterium]